MEGYLHHSIPRPLINKPSLPAATRAMTKFLQRIMEEVARNFLVHRVANISAWFQFLDRIGANILQRWTDVL